MYLTLNLKFLKYSKSILDNFKVLLTIKEFDCQFGILALIHCLAISSASFLGFLSLYKNKILGKNNLMV
jgi:hypothetical protein